MDKKERFQLAKKNVLRRFPKAVTEADSRGKFYVAQNGVDICNKELHKAVKRGASLEDWLNAESMITANRVIESNTERFSDEKVANKKLEE